MPNDLLTRAAQFEPSTFDTTKRTVQVVFSTGAPVQRYDMAGPYTEVLDLSPEAVDFSQIVGGSVLDNHDRFGSVSSILGIVESASTDGTRASAMIRFGERPEIQGIVTDVRGGVIRQVSAGYTVQRWEESKDAVGNRTKLARRWTPKEVSFTQLAADPQATTRSAEEPMNPTNLTQPTTTAAAPTPVNPSVTTNPQPQTQQPTVRSIGELAGMDAGQITSMEQRNLSVEDARREALEHLQRRSGPPARTMQPATVTPIGFDDPVFVRAAIAEAIHSRINRAVKVSEAGQRFIGYSLVRAAEFILRTRNIETLGLSDASIIERALHSTSDFPLLLGDTMNKVLREAYALAPAAIKAIARQTTLNDFRSKYSLQLGEAPILEKVNQSGEFKSGTISEGRESYALSTYGKIFGITRQALINDNLGAFSDIGALFARGATQFEAQFIVDLLTMNSGGGPKMSDGQNLFHASHGNLAGSGAVISDTSLSAARLAMRTQKGLDGKTPIDVVPKFLLVPAMLETTAEKYLATLNPTQASDVNPFSGKLTQLTDPRLDPKSATRWYVFADPAQIPCIEYAYLSGYEGPQVDTRAGFEVDGVQIRCRLDFGAGALDSRGAYANPGA